MSTEETPLLWNESISPARNKTADVHVQFCALVGCPPSNAPPGYKYRMNKKSLYGRVNGSLTAQNREYMFSASVSNTLLLTQVVLGASLTALGASGSSPLIITIFGVINTIIAGLVAYIKSRGQPMRSRMYRDDLTRVIDEIDNSEVMWLGISQGVHGYDQIDTDTEVTVRSEVARLTRLYDRAVRTNALNNPDAYTSGGVQHESSTLAGLRSNTVAGTETQNAAATIPASAPAADAAVANAPAPAPAPAQASAPASTPIPAPAAAAPADPDQSPASAVPKPKPEPTPAEPKKEADPAPASAPAKSEAEDVDNVDNDKEDDVTTPAKADSNNGKSASTAESSTTPPPAAAATKQAPPAETSAPTPPAPAPAPVAAAAAAATDPDASPATRSSFPAKKPPVKPDAPTKVKGEDE